jgi:PST family polysaccharide transporter
VADASETAAAGVAESDAATSEQASQSVRSDAAFVYGGYLLRYLSLIVLVPYYGRVLGPSSYGEVLAGMSLMNVVWMVVGFGFSPLGARELASSRNADERARIFGRQTASRLVLVPLGLVVGVGGTFSSGVLAKHPVFGLLGTALGIVAAFNLGWLFQGLRRFRLSMALEALSYPLNLAFVLLTVRSSSDGRWAMLSVLFSSCICASVAYVTGFRFTSLRWPRWREVTGEVSAAALLFVGSMGSMIMTAGSTYLLSLFSTAREVGYFGTAERFAAVGLGLLGPATQVLMPTISSLHRDGSTRATELARKGLLLEVSYGVCVCIAGVTLAPIVLPWAMGREFQASSRILQVLSCLFPFATFSHAIQSYVLIPLRHERLLKLTTGFAAGVNVLVIVIAAPIWGAFGVALARVLAEIAGAAAMIFAVGRLGELQRLFASPQVSAGE